MRWLKNLFTPSVPVDRPSKAMVKQKITNIENETDRSSIIVGHQKEKLRDDVQKLEDQAKIVQEEIQKFTAQAIAIATGNYPKDLNE